jgi:hypothetical protein
METPQHQLRRLPTAETLESMTNEESSRLGDDHHHHEPDDNDNVEGHRDDGTAASEGTTSTPRRRRPLLESLNAKRRQVQYQQRLRGKRRSFVEDFYRVDKIPSLKQPRPASKHHHKQHHHHPADTKRFKVILPGLPAYEADWARDSHDFFNLVVLVPVLVLNAINWNWEILLSDSAVLSGDLSTLHKAWIGEYFDAFFWLTAAYFIVDLLWIAVNPICVKSPTTILQHHLAVLVYIMIPYFRPEVRWCMGACMTVEVNTWFLIARRVFNKQGFPPWTTLHMGWLSIRVKLISICFYVTWISVRCILYPALIIPFYQHWCERSMQVKSWWNVMLLSLPLHLAFCLLNLKWSYELLMSKVRYWRRLAQLRKRGMAHVVEAEVSKGL